MGDYTLDTVRTGRTVRPVAHCSFCNKSEASVEWLVAAHKRAAYICDTCTEAAVSTLKEARRIERSRGRYR